MQLIRNENGSSAFILVLMIAGAIGMASLLSLQYHVMSAKGEAASETALDQQILQASIDSMLRDPALCILAVSGGSVPAGHPKPNKTIPTLKLTSTVLSVNSFFNSLKVKDMQIQTPTPGTYVFHMDLLTRGSSYLGSTVSFNINLLPSPATAVTAGRISACQSAG